MPTDRMAAQVEDWQAHGQYSFTREDVRRALGRWTTSTRDSLRRLTDNQRLVRPRSGFYAVVPPEYRSTGTPPPTWYVDALMRYLEQPYYVGLLSAAAMYGAAHQAPQEFQVVTDRPTRVLHAGRARVRFIMNRRVTETPVRLVNTHTGTMRVSTPAATAFDLVIYLHRAGEIDNVATVLGELAEQIDTEELRGLVRAYPDAVARRLGYLLERVNAPQATAIAGALERPGGRPPARLHPRLPADDAPVDDRWHLRVNVDIDPDDA